MKKAVWKYTLDVNVGEQPLAIPHGASLVHFEEQHETITFWALVDPDAPYEDRVFKVFGTGHQSIQDNEKHVGTVVMAHGTYVWHIFEVLEAH